MYLALLRRQHYGVVGRTRCIIKATIVLVEPGKGHVKYLDHQSTTCEALGGDYSAVLSSCPNLNPMGCSRGS